MTQDEKRALLALAANLRAGTAPPRGPMLETLEHDVGRAIARLRARQVAAAARDRFHPNTH